MADSRTYIRVHDGMPDHPKVDGLSDAAFRLLVTTWCWCSRHLTDGHVPAATWKKRGTLKARRELLAAGLAEEVDDGVSMHDYLEHQRSADDVREIRDARGKGGSLGNHIRWHVRRGVTDSECEFCVGGDPTDIASGSQDRSDKRSQDRSDKRDGIRSRTGNEHRDKNLDHRSTEPYSDHPPEYPSKASTSADVQNDVANRSQDRSQDRSQKDRKTSPETVSETEGFGGSVGESPSLRNARTREDDDQDSKIDNRIIGLLQELTGRTVGIDHAAKVRRQILDDRQIDNPAAYVAAAIRGAPRDYLPASTIAPPVAEARRAAGATGPGTDPTEEFRRERERIGRRS